MMFKKELLDLVLSGRKTQTRRLHSRLLRVGHIYAIQVSRVESTGYYIKITNVYQQRLGDVSEDEAAKEGFDNLEEFKETWIRISGSWDSEMKVVVYDFELSDPPPKQSKLS